MPLFVNLRHLEAHNVRLQGELSVEELDIDSRDEVIQVNQPLEYDLEVQKLEDGLLAARPVAPGPGLPVRPLPQALPISPGPQATGPAMCRWRARMACPWLMIAWT